MTATIPASGFVERSFWLDSLAAIHPAGRLNDAGMLRHGLLADGLRITRQGYPSHVPTATYATLGCVYG
jgi:hypothetical protein